MAIEHQHVTGEWRITAVDSRNDPDALPETETLKGRVHFTARFDAWDRFASLLASDEAGTYQLIVRGVTYPVVAGRLMDLQARDGVMLPAVIDGVPIVWTARPELMTDPGRGVDGSPVVADTVTWAPPDPVDGLRSINLAEVVDGTIEFAEPVVSAVAVLAAEARYERDLAEAAATSATAASSAASGSSLAAAGYADDAETAAGAAAESAAAASGSASTASAAATAANEDADATEADRIASAASASAADASATAAAGSAAAAASSATAADASADRAELAAQSAEATKPEGGWTEADLSASVNASLDKADAALQSVAVADVSGLPAALDAKSDDGHGHTIGEVTGLTAALDGKAPTPEIVTILPATGTPGKLYLILKA